MPTARANSLSWRRLIEARLTTGLLDIFSGLANSNPPMIRDFLLLRHTCQRMVTCPALPADQGCPAALAREQAAEPASARARAPAPQGPQTNPPGLPKPAKCANASAKKGPVASPHAEPSPRRRPAPKAGHSGHTPCAQPSPDPPSPPNCHSLDRPCSAPSPCNASPWSHQSMQYTCTI